MARAIAERSPGRLPADYCLHVNEIVWAIQNAGPAPYQVTTTFKPLQPVEDADRRTAPDVRRYRRSFLRSWG